MDAVGYTRISEKDQSNNSLNNQQIGIAEYCNRNNLTLHKVFTDNGKSAFTFDRPEWLKLEAYIKQNKSVKYLIVYHLDRFSRANLMDALIKLHEIESKLKVKVLTVSDSINQDNTDLSIQMMRTINLLFSNNERNRIQDRVKDGVYRSLSSGRFCNKAPVGYLNSRDAADKPLLVIDKSKAKYIKEVFKLFNNGLNVEAIRQLVPELKLTGNSAIQHILNNSIYAGLIQLPAYKGNPAMEIKAIHEPIIQKHEYYQAQTKLNKKKVTTQLLEDVWLRGILHCHCGRKMTAGNSKSRSGKYYWYYKCNTHNDINYRADKLHSQFIEILDVLSFDENDVDYFRTKLEQSISDYQSNKGGMIMRLKIEQQKTEKKMKEVQEKFLTSEVVDKKVFESTMNELKEKLSGIDAQLIKAKTNTDNMLTMLSELLPKLSRMSEVFIKFPLHQQHEFINTLFPFPLRYDEFYRTTNIHPMFADKALILNEKKLLKIEQLLDNSGKLLLSTRDGSLIEHLENLLKAFVA